MTVFFQKLPGWRRWRGEDGTEVTLGPDGRWWNFYSADFDAWFEAALRHQIIDDLVGMDNPEGEQS